ncbi:PREDICTED: uncharacterized protein LOC108762153, partial [Trachymyrmex cornetzi]|uniref:uncharacterized protein LOC108762153 n=1 Tax=Trachymyrmex cornetzi TaxID=471704 RepID=UPI00084F3976
MGGSERLGRLRLFSKEYDNKDTLLFYLLPHLIEGSRKRKRISTNSQVHNLNKLSIQERRDSFLLHVQTATDIIPGIQRRKEELRIAGLTFQPTSIFVGQLIAIDASYVAVKNVLYKVDSSLEAIDLCFRLYMALDCAYPEQASSLWIFIQKCCFDIHLQSDVCNRSLNILIGEVDVLFSKDNTIITNFIQGKLWKNINAQLEGKTVLPLFLYFDDYETNNPLGSHKGISKCGAVYLSIACLPPKLNRKVFSNSTTFSKVIDELRYLENNGITICHNNEKKCIYFKLSLILGDNLGLHSILGLVESFNTMQF